VSARPHRRRLAKGRHRGATLVVGLILLGLVILLGLAGARSAQVERQLAHNERFRENASAAASAGIEIATGRILAATAPREVPAHAEGVMPDSHDRFVTETRFSGFEVALPQEAGNFFVAAHFEIVSTGYSSRRAIDRQRATVMVVAESPEAIPLPCATPVAPRCCRAGVWQQTSWQRLAPE
jgi:hypothetical protein